MGPVETLLRKAGELITPDAQRYWGHHMAVNEAGGHVIPWDTTARRWCLGGALVAARGGHGPDLYDDAERLLDGTARRYGFSSAIRANQDTAARLTPDLFSEAIETAAEFGL